MNSAGLSEGTVIRGVLYRGVEDHAGSAALARLTNRGIEVDLPLAGRGHFDDESDGWGQESRQAWLDGDEGTFFVPDIRCVAQRRNSRITAETWLAPRVVEVGRLNGLRGHDYQDVNGMASSIVGLSTWAGVSGIEQRVSHGGEEPAYTLEARLIEPTTLGGPFNLCLCNGFSYDPMNQGIFRGVRNMVTIQTLDNYHAPWIDHAAVHRLVQDLICMAFGEAREMRLSQVVRHDDQPTFMDSDQPLLWRDAYDPFHGRLATGPGSSSGTSLLFRFEDVDRASLTKFFSESSRWGRAISIASAVLFVPDCPPQMRLTQIGVALESLGYAIWRNSNDSGRTPPMPHLLELVCNAADISHRAVYGNLSSQGWIRQFNACFKGAKHADNPLPDPHEAHVLAGQGLNLIRVWLARFLGVHSSVMEANLDRIRC